MSGLQVFSQTVHGADPVAFWVAVLLAAIVAVVGLRQGLRAFWQLRIIVDTPTARIRSAPQGYVELQGRAQPRAEPIVGHLTGTPCVWYRYRIQERRRGERHDRWVTVERGDAGRPFILDDGSGRCLIQPDGAELRCRDKQVWLSGGEGLSGQQAIDLDALLRRHRRYRMTEERIGIDEEVYLLGHYETPRRGPEQRRLLMRRLLTQWKRDPERMQAFDRNGDGDIDPTEWEAARSRAEQVAEQAEARLSQQPPLPVVGPTDDPHRPFVVSTLGESALAGSLRWRAAAGTMLGLLLGVGAALALVIRTAG